jgi:hypothetical protein
MIDSSSLQNEVRRSVVLSWNLDHSTGLYRVVATASASGGKNQIRLALLLAGSTPIRLTMKMKETSPAKIESEANFAPVVRRQKIELNTDNRCKRFCLTLHPKPEVPNRNRRSPGLSFLPTREFCSPLRRVVSPLLRGSRSFFTCVSGNSRFR